MKQTITFKNAIIKWFIKYISKIYCILKMANSHTTLSHYVVWLSVMCELFHFFINEADAGKIQLPNIFTA